MLTSKGHNVEVITLTSNMEADNFSFKVHRTSNCLSTWKVMRRADYIIQFNVSLKGILPCVLSFKPLVISHQTTNFDRDGKYTRFGRMKQFIAGKIASLNIVCSNYVGKFIKNAEVIHNSYNESLFRKLDGVERSGDLIFLGRLVSDKGCDLIIDALKILEGEHCMRPRLTIVGDGPESAALKQQAGIEGVLDQIHFAGSRQGEELVKLLNQHRIMIVPSVWEEPFGIVALEGLACGCHVVVANSGGLPEAVGQCGLVFERGNSNDLAVKLRYLLTHPERSEMERVNAHLNSFTLEKTYNRLMLALQKK